jgi:hypothetical protein
MHNEFNPIRTVTAISKHLNQNNSKYEMTLVFFKNNQFHDMIQAKHTESKGFVSDIYLFNKELNNNLYNFGLFSIRENIANNKKLLTRIIFYKNETIFLTAKESKELDSIDANTGKKRKLNPNEEYADSDLFKDIILEEPEVKTLYLDTKEFLEPIDETKEVLKGLNLSDEEFDILEEILINEEDNTLIEKMKSLVLLFHSKEYNNEELTKKGEKYLNKINTILTNLELNESKEETIIKIDDTTFGINLYSPTPKKIEHQLIINFDLNDIFIVDNTFDKETENEELSEYFQINAISIEKMINNPELEEFYTTFKEDYSEFIKLREEEKKAIQIKLELKKETIEDLNLAEDMPLKEKIYILIGTLFSKEISVEQNEENEENEEDIQGHFVFSKKWNKKLDKTMQILYGIGIEESNLKLKYILDQNPHSIYIELFNSNKIEEDYLEEYSTNNNDTDEDFNIYLKFDLKNKTLSVEKSLNNNENIIEEYNFDNNETSFKDKEDIHALIQQIKTMLTEHTK